MNDELLAKPGESRVFCDTYNPAMPSASPCPTVSASSATCSTNRAAPCSCTAENHPTATYTRLLAASWKPPKAKARPTAPSAKYLEETGITVAPGDLHLTGIVSEKAFKHENHWLMFLYEVTRPVDVVHGREADGEGRLEWHTLEGLDGLNLPDNDRVFILPLFWKNRGGFFAVHIDCSGEKLKWTVEQ